MSVFFVLLFGAIVAFFGHRVVAGIHSGWMQMPVRLFDDPYFCRADEPRLFWAAASLNGFFALTGALGFVVTVSSIVTGK